MSQKMDAAEMLTVVAHKKEEKTEHAAEEDQHAAQQQRLKQELQLFNNNSSNGMAITITTNGFGVTAAAQSASQREHRRQQQQQSFYHKKTAKRVELAKRKARSELQKCGWQSVGYALDTRWLDTRPEAGPDTIERVDASRMSYEQFVDRYERPGKPVILLGLTETWRANQRWNLPLLLRGYRNQKFKCGEDDDGYSVKLKMKYYVHYASTTQDDSPLYIFDSGFGDVRKQRPKTAKLLEDYEVPPMFKDDLFRYATDRRRPPHRWFVMGPARSGTAIHIDPLGTSAWNALVVGHKKWCLIHPTAPKLLVKPSRDESGPHPSEAVNWFNTVYRRVLSPQWPSDQFPVIHAVQAPGEVMFVPSGWWHVVMNLNSTIAVTQNFCSISNLPKVWPKTVKSRPQLAVHWLKALRAQRPELGGPLIEAINRSNGIPPLVVDEPCDSSSSSSSSDGSDSESEDGEDIGQQQQQKQPIPASISHTNSNGQQQQLGHGLGQHGHHQHRHNQTQQHHQNQSHHRGSGQQCSSAAAGETNGNGNDGPMRGGGVDGECEPAVINQAVADAQRIAIVRFVDQSAADEQQMGEASEEKFGRQQNGRNNNNHAAAGGGGGEAESSGQHAKKRKHCSTSSSNHQQQQQRHRSLPAAYQQQNSNHNNH